MPCLRSICECGERLVIYVPPSMLHQAVPVATDQQLIEVDRREDPMQFLREMESRYGGVASIIDARWCRRCPGCAKELRFSDSPGLLLVGPIRSFPCSHMLWDCAQHLATEYGAGEIVIGSVVANFMGLKLCDVGIGEDVSDAEAALFAKCLRESLPDIAPEAKQTGQIESPKVMLSGRFRPVVAELVEFLDEGGFRIESDLEAITLVSDEETEEFCAAVRRCSTSLN